MNFVYKQISAARWGIYSGSRLLATVSDRATCEAIMANFTGDRGNGSGERQSQVSSKHQPQGNWKGKAARSSESATAAASQNAQGSKQLGTSGQKSSFLSEASVNKAESQSKAQDLKAGDAALPDSLATNGTIELNDADLARILNIKSLKVKELESAVLRAQMSQRNRDRTASV